MSSRPFLSSRQVLKAMTGFYVLLFFAYLLSYYWTSEGGPTLLAEILNCMVELRRRGL